MINRLTVRVYGILYDDNKRVLLSDEYIRGNYFTKFPGGGLELGEGTRACLIREFKEETGLDITVGDHIYTTDYFQVSGFNYNDQIISIYYYVHTHIPVSLNTKTIPFDFAPEQIQDPNGQSEVLRWIDWNQFNSKAVSLPIDKIVADLLKGQ